jgi:hypothetical protein
MPLSLEAVFYVEDPPEIEFRDGLFHLATTIGGMRFERVMLPHVFAKSIWRGEQALRLFRSGANVVELRAKVPDEDCPAAHG